MINQVLRHILTRSADGLWSFAGVLAFSPMVSLRRLYSHASKFIYNTLSRPGGVAFVAFLFIYLAAVRYCRHAYYRDPTSFFLDPDRAYERRYSSLRQNDAKTFIHNANSTTFPRSEPKKLKMCIGIATVAREGEQYVLSTIGSLLDGLDPNERDEIHLGVLIAHTDPNVHPIYGQKWLTNVVDKVYLYDIAKERLRKVEKWEKENDYRWKAVYDYTYILQRCVDTGAQWIAIIEDDTLAMDGWYSQAIEAATKADELHQWGSKSEWLYLRLFYTEEFFGWNKEEWPNYLAASVGITGMIAMVLLFIRQFAFEKWITNILIAVVCFVCTPACIALYFMAGRLSMQPLQPGVHKLPNFGCCGQALVFSPSMAPKIVSRLAQKRVGFVDEILDEFAREADLNKLVIIPSLLQHIGSKTSKADDFGNTKTRKTVSEKIWNFGFEMHQE